MGGIRARLAVTLVALVAVTVTAIGLGVYAFVDASLRTRAIEDARQQVDYGLSVLLPGADPAPTDARAFEASGLPGALALRGSGRVLAEFGDGAPYEPDDMAGALALISPELRAIVARGDIGYVWQPMSGQPALVVGGRQAGPPELYVVFPAGPIEEALAQLRIGLLAAGAAAIGFALLVAGLLARWILRPVGAAGRAARRLAAGDLSARVPDGGRDELGRLGAEFNRMADALEGTVVRLETAQGQNRRFVADVAHELRTPLTALVAEASLIEGHTAALPPDARRAAELLVADVRRLRVLVDDLMEVSRFDANAERPAVEPVDLGRVVTGAVAARLPEAAVSLPPMPLVVDSDPRRLDRILGNLLDNARDHAPGAAVEVALQRTRDGAVIVVADRGPGVPGDAIAHLFDRFYKADASRAGGSSGLGLSIAAEHAALLGGSLRARNRPGGGLVVVLTLPVTGSLPVGDATDTGATDAGAAWEVAPRTRS
ncbi:MAG TPA: HAMP domain-containing sensor histidine kinase [Candidatus Limnocylindrales bacterium]|nr:HAMP domain-containing sensor histidine kinase [Candidatus Limnocylindrales bacterium]